MTTGSTRLPPASAPFSSPGNVRDSTDHTRGITSPGGRTRHQAKVVTRVVVIEFQRQVAPFFGRFTPDTLDPTGFRIRGRSGSSTNSPQTRDPDPSAAAYRPRNRPRRGDR